MVAVRGRIPQRHPMRRPALGQLSPPARPVPKGMLARWFQKRVEFGIETAAMKAQSASAKPAYKKVLFSRGIKPAVAQKPMKRRAA